ncbi:MAG TPA: hypothetical protein VLK56_03395 [Solirubrobacterales bacterium]|nr:hypothetical protein [Solirubrobacterales bacterium]
MKYIDYRRDCIDDPYTFAPLVHKRKYFEDEKELRAVISGRQIEEDVDGWQWREEDSRLGISAEVDLNELLDEVRVTPADRILGSVVPSLVDRYGLKVEVGQSSLDDPPRF